MFLYIYNDNNPWLKVMAYREEPKKKHLLMKLSSVQDMGNDEKIIFGMSDGMQIVLYFNEDIIDYDGI